MQRPSAHVQVKGQKNRPGLTTAFRPMSAGAILQNKKNWAAGTLEGLLQARGIALKKTSTRSSLTNSRHQPEGFLTPQHTQCSPPSDLLSEATSCVPTHILFLLFCLSIPITMLIAPANGRPVNPSSNSQHVHHMNNTMRNLSMFHELYYQIRQTNYHSLSLNRDIIISDTSLFLSLTIF